MGKRSDLELVKGWQTIRAEFEAMERMSCVPAGIKKVRADHIFDCLLYTSPSPRD